jgi:hypothetical protein
MIGIPWKQTLFKLKFVFILIIQCLALILLKISILYYPYSVCLSVWQSIGSAPGRDADLRPVSLEPASSEPNILGKDFPEKWPLAKLPKKNVMQLMLFYAKNIVLLF